MVGWDHAPSQRCASLLSADLNVNLPPVQLLGRASAALHAQGQAIPEQVKALYTLSKARAKEVIDNFSDNTLRPICLVSGSSEQS